MLFMKYKQKNIQINGITLPEIKHKGVVYYPLTYTFERILLKSKQAVSTLKNRGYERHLMKFKVSFNFNNGGTHDTYCISKYGLVELLKVSYVGGLTVEQRQHMNSLLSYFGEDLVNEQPRYKNNINYRELSEYDEFEKDCISETLDMFGDLEWQKCTKCNKYYPLHGNFFRFNNSQQTWGTICRNCLNTDSRHTIAHPDIFLTKIYREYGDEVYKYYKNHNVMSIYNHYIENNMPHFPSILANKIDLLTIIKYLYDNREVDKDNITFKFLNEKHRLLPINQYLTQDEIYSCLFPNKHPRQFPWHYKSYIPRPRYNIDEAKVIFSNYLTENNIEIDDIYSFNYYEVAKKSRIGKLYCSDILNFAMEYNDNRYPAYKFNITSVNYWKSKENRMMALKFLIEEDMDLEIEKVPLYLTITSIRNIGTATMYNVLKKYYNSIYDWVDEIYPDVFDPKDFDINYMRNEFDSIDEQTIDDILRDNFDNVLYNPNHNEHTIKLVDKVPDWFIFTTNGVIVVEYFGMWAKKRGMYNSRTRDYIIRSKDKIEKYKALQGYRFLYIFPGDLDKNYEGLYKKIKDVKNNKILSKTI